MKTPKRNAHLRTMLRDLGRALSEAIAESPEVGRSLQRIRNQGYSLHLLLDCKQEGEDEQSPALGCADAPASRRSAPGEPDFRIDTTDLSFLRSIGIDPTRRLRRRRS